MFFIGTVPVVSGLQPVKVYMVTPSMAENTSGKMEVHFKLPSKANRIKQVYYNLSGTALFNNDFSVTSDTILQKVLIGNGPAFTYIPLINLLNGSQGYIFIDSAKSEAILKLDPVSDSVYEQTETIIVSLGSGGDYVLTDSTTTTATILNDDMAPPVIAANGPLSFCGGGSVTLTATSPDAGTVYTSYLWSNGATTKSITVNATGNYTVTAKNSAGTSAKSQGAMVRKSVIASTFTSTNATCFGTATGAIQVTATGGILPYNYKTDSLGAYLPSSILKPLKAGIYKVFMKDSIGCTAKTNLITIGQLQPLTVSFSKTNPSCIGKADGTITATATGGKPPYAYRLGTSGLYGDPSKFTGLAPGTYNVYVKGLLGCTGSTGTITISPATNSCFAQSITVTAATNTDITATPLQVLLTPNPARNQFALQVLTNENEEVSIRVMDVNGRNMYASRGLPNQTFKFGEAFMSGMYLVEVRQGKEVKTIKAIKIRE